MSDTAGTASPPDALDLILKCIDPSNIFAVDLKPAIAQLRNEGMAGTHRLMPLLTELVRCRSDGVVYALRVAADIEPTRELKELFAQLAVSPPVIHAAPGHFNPEIFGDGRIGWTDSTHARVRQLAHEGLVNAETWAREKAERTRQRQARAAETPAQPPAQPQYVLPPRPLVRETTQIYAPMNKRVAAFLIDAVLVLVPEIVVLGLAAALGMSALGMLLMWGVFAGYFAWFEASPTQATPGKKLLGMKVCDMIGDRLDPRKAALRGAGHLASMMPMGLGFLAAPFTPRRQALHDIIAGTLVVPTDMDVETLNRSALGAAPKCDVCTTPMQRRDGYLLRSQQLLASESYVNYLAGRLAIPVIRQTHPDVDDVVMAALLPAAIIAARAQAVNMIEHTRTLWLVCDDCMRTHQLRGRRDG